MYLHVYRRHLLNTCPSWEGAWAQRKADPNEDIVTAVTRFSGAVIIGKSKRSLGDSLTPLLLVSCPAISYYSHVFIYLNHYLSAVSERRWHTEKRLIYISYSNCLGSLWKMNRWGCLATTHTHKTPPPSQPLFSQFTPNTCYPPRPSPTKCLVNLSLLIAQNSGCHMPRSDF